MVPLSADLPNKSSSVSVLDYLRDSSVVKSTPTGPVEYQCKIKEIDCKEKLF